MTVRRPRHRAERFLIAGDSADLGEVRALLTQLPDDAYGQVLIESDGDECESFVAPPRMSVIRLRAEVLPGAALANALTAWLAEWLPEEVPSEQVPTIWLGAAANPRLDPVRERVARARKGAGVSPQIDA